MEINSNTFYDKVIDFFYDDYFKDEECHDDWTDDEIVGSIQQDDIDRCLDKMREALYKHFGIKEGEK